MTTTTRTWERLEPAVMTAGDVGGDWQISEAYSARWALPLDPNLDAAARLDGDPTWAVIDCAYYGAAASDDDVVGGYVPEHGHVRVVYSFVLCTDRDHAFDTDVISPVDVDVDVDTDVDGDVDTSDLRIREFAENDEAPDADFWNAHTADSGFPWMAVQA